MNQLPLWISGLTATCLSILYVFWEPRHAGKSCKRTGFPGLHNFGNTCFLNAILQSWASCPSVVTWLGLAASQHPSGCHRQTRVPPLTAAVTDILKLLNNECEENEHCDACDPSAIFTEMKVKGWIFSSEQQDCHELMHALLETLQEENSDWPTAGLPTLLDKRTLLQDVMDTPHPVTVVSRAMCQLHRLPRKQIGPLHGLMASQVTCLSCGRPCPVKYEAFDSITLNLSKPACILGGVSVEELLQDSVRTQFIYSAKCPSCATDSNSCTEPVVKCWHDATSLKDTGGVKCHQVISPSNRPQDITDITFVRCQQVSTGTAQLGLTNNENEATEVTLNGNINIAASENCDIVRPTADREVSVKISYQNASGDGKHLDSTETMLHHDVSKATPNQDAMGTIPNHGSLTHEDIIRSNPSQDIDHGHGSLTHEDIIRSNPSQDIAGVMPRRYIKESSSKHNVAFTSCQQPNRNRTAHRDVSSTPLRQYTARSPFLVGLSHTLSIARSPQCLCIHINRTHVTSCGMAIKLQQHVSFPERLSLDQYMYDRAGNHLRKPTLCGGQPHPRFSNPLSSVDGLMPCSADSRKLDCHTMMSDGVCPPSASSHVQSVCRGEEHQKNSSILSLAAGDMVLPKRRNISLYHLTAVVSHLGNVDSGHFVTYRRGQRHQLSDQPCHMSETWWLMSDTAVCEASFSSVLASQAYMLFYERAQ